MPVADELRALAAATSFQTRLPIGRVVVVDGDDVARAGVAFPLIGAAIGAAVGGVFVGLAPHVSPLLAAGLALALGALLTGALHLDALADTADALGAATRERALEIMRDHSIGAYGASALVLDLLVKAAALAALDPRARTIGIVAAASALARAASVVLAATLPYARPSGGTGASLTTGGAARAIAGAAIAAALAILLAGATGAVLVGVVAGLALAAGLLLRAWLGGVTGDTLGAVVELAETAALVAAVAMDGSGWAGCC